MFREKDGIKPLAHTRATSKNNSVQTSQFARRAKVGASFLDIMMENTLLGYPNNSRALSTEGCAVDNELASKLRQVTAYHE